MTRRIPGSWRYDVAVLVTDAHAMGSIAVIRSLGRAGYRVLAASHLPEAIGLRSRFCCQALLCPDVARSQDYHSWLLDTIEVHSIRAIVPSEGVLLAVRNAYTEFSRLLPFHENSDVVYRGLSKAHLFERFRSDKEDRALPRLYIFTASDLASDDSYLDTLPTPMFVKVDAVNSRNSSPSRVIRCESGGEARQFAFGLLAEYSKVLVQGYVPGFGVGVFLLRWKGRVLAKFMHQRLHEVPHTGGASSYRRAWWHDAIILDAERRARLMDWEGVAMFEYRWNPASDEFWLIEMNGRFWGSLHLALFAGVDFPRLLIDAFVGHGETCDGFELSTRCRWTFPREVEYVWSCLKDRTLPISFRIGRVAEFFALGLNPLVHSDLNFPGDRGLYWLGFKHAIAKWARPADRST